MRVVVMSDSHGDPQAVQQVLQQHPTADGFLHLGDGYRDWAFEQISPPRFLRGVCGNNDWSSAVPEQLVLDLDGVVTLAVHGHTCGVKGGLGRLKQLAQQKNAQLVLFGHTHRPFTDYTDSMWLVNPGSLGEYRNPTYCIVEIKNGKVTDVKHCSL